MSKTKSTKRNLAKIIFNGAILAAIITGFVVGFLWGIEAGLVYAITGAIVSAIGGGIIMVISSIGIIALFNIIHTPPKC